MLFIPTLLSMMICRLTGTTGKKDYKLDEGMKLKWLSEKFY